MPQLHTAGGRRYGSPMDAETLQGILDLRHETFSIPDLVLDSVEPGRVVVIREVTKDVANMGGALHGGAAATLVDIVGTLAIMTADPDHRPGVSTDLNVSWFAPAPIGDTVRVVATVPKVGRSLAFTSVDLFRESDGTLVAQGRMTKSLPAPRG